MEGLKANCDKKFQTLTENSRGCDWIPLSANSLGSGKYGCTFQVCCNGDCNFVVKIVPITTSAVEQKMQREVHMQKMFGTSAPEVTDAFICNNNAYIVMAKKDMTIEGFVSMLKNMGKSTSEIMQQIDNIEAEVKTIVKEAHAKGLLHGDLHRENIMLNLLKNAEGQPVAWTNIQLIDFGKSKQLKPNDEDLKEEADGIRMTFNLLRNFAKEPISRGPPSLKTKTVADCALPTRTTRPTFFSPATPSTPRTPRTPQRGPRLFFDDDEVDFKPRGNLFDD
jgi:serine/threonine protein kinase